MPFIQIKSNLTNLRFGNDQPGYGSSGLPYIKFTPPTQTISENGLNQKSVFFSKTYADIGAIGNVSNFNTGPAAEQVRLYNALRTSSDYPIRGGSIDFQIGQQTYTLSSKIDAERIRAFFEDKAKGTAFIQKQVGLQLTNPKIETGNTLFSIGQGLPFSGLLENTRVYNKGINTLAQVGVQGIGAHALRHGLVPFAPLQKHYYAIVNAQNVNNEPVTNRLLNLNALKMTSGVSPFVDPQNVFDINTVNNLGISLNRNLLFQYLGGPGSTYGIGATTIKRVVDTTKVKSSRVMAYDLLKKQQGLNKIIDGKTGQATTNIQDFRRQIFDSGQIDINNENDRKTFAGMWNDNQSVDYRFFVKSGINKVDKLNKSLPFLFENNTNPWDVPLNNDDSSDDLIKFVFEAINNDHPSMSTALFFRAFLTAGITDNNSATLNAFKYMGRGENFYTYQGFDRSISFSFRMVAMSQKELKPMYNRLNTLISQVYPDYGANKFMRAPLVRVTIGDYISRMPGFLESVNVTVDNASSWDINLYNTSAQLPQVLDVSIAFKPILDELPKRVSYSFDKTNDWISADTNLDLGTTTETYQTQNAVSRIIANRKEKPIIQELPAIAISRKATAEEINSQRIYEENEANIARYNLEDAPILQGENLINTNGVRVTLD